MKTYNDITHLSYNDLSFFSGMSVIDCKFFIAKHLEIKKVTKKGVPSVKLSDKVEKEKIDFTMRSNSELEGADRMKYLCDFYNRGVDPATFMKFGENETFKKHIKFTGVSSILNDILNRDQYRRLQEKWLFSNTYGKSQYKKEVHEFAKNHPWAAQKLNLETA